MSEREPEYESAPEPETEQQEQAGPNAQQDDQTEIIEKLVSERDSLKDAMLRTMAEAQNIQRRLKQQMETERKFASEPLVREILPIMDNFKRTLEAAKDQPNIETLIDGVGAIERQMIKALQSVNVEAIFPEGQPFDPEFHEAIVTYDTADLPEGTVIDVLETGYKMNDRVIRPAKVRVSKLP